MKYSIRSLIVLSLIVFLAFVAIYEQKRADRLASQLRQLEHPMVEAIRQQEWLVQKRQLALDYSKDSVRKQMERANKAHASKDEGAKPKFSIIMGVGPFDNELANIRNAELKLSREKAKLQGLKKELEQHRARLGD